MDEIKVTPHMNYLIDKITQIKEVLESVNNVEKLLIVEGEMRSLYTLLGMECEKVVNNRGLDA